MGNRLPDFDTSGNNSFEGAAGKKESERAGLALSVVSGVRKDPVAGCRVRGFVVRIKG